MTSYQPGSWRTSARITPAVNAHSWAGSSDLARPSNGPAVTLRTSTPGHNDSTGGWSLDVARVKISTSTPRAASRRAVSTM